MAIFLQIFASVFMVCKLRHLNFWKAPQTSHLLWDNQSALWAHTVSDRKSSTNAAENWRLWQTSTACGYVRSPDLWVPYHCHTSPVENMLEELLKDSSHRSVSTAGEVKKHSPRSLMEGLAQGIDWVGGQLRNHWVRSVARRAKLHREYSLTIPN